MKLKMPKVAFGVNCKEEYDKIMAEPETPEAKLNNAPDLEGYIYVPSLGLYVARRRTLSDRTWDQAHEELSEQGLRMPTILEFIEFLKYTRDNNQDIYEDITAVRDPWRAEWLDAYFEKRSNGMLRGSDLYILTNNKTKAEKLDEDTLMEDKWPGIDLEDLLDNHNDQGLPRKEVKEGSLYYWRLKHDGGVAWFAAVSSGADLSCGMDPQDSDSGLGVRAVREK